MQNNNKYEDMSAIEALKLIAHKKMLLPDIQREYCWDEKDIESLFESIADDYPVGSCIFWKTNKAVLNSEKPNLYYFIQKCKRHGGEVFTKNEKAPESISEDGDYYIVLDGQQRLTSLNIALFGSYTILPKGKKKKFLDNWITCELYYNLDFYKQNEDDNEIPVKRFAFLSKEQAENGNWFKVKKLIEFNKKEECKEALSSQNMDERCVEDLSRLFSRLIDSSSKGLVHYYCINQDNYDIALNIFVRVNSTGKKLTKTDLLFSTLINGWNNGRDEIDALIQEINSLGDGFSFTRDYLMRLCLVLENADTNLKIQNLNSKVTENIRKDWDKIKTSLRTMVNTLVDIGYTHEYLVSYNATMPLVYYIYNGGEFKTDESRQGARKFIAVSAAKGLFGVASNSALSLSREALKKVDCKKVEFNLDLFKDVVLTGGRKFVASHEEIQEWVDRFEKGQNTYLLLTLLYPDLKLGQVTFHQDHVHPYAGFGTKNLKKLGLDDDTISTWQRIRNTLPNLQFLEGKENESKNKTCLLDWVNEKNDFKYHPTGVSLELKDFDEFYKERRELILNELYKIFD